MSKEVQDAVKNGAPIVALESTIISHGMPFPENKKTALEVQNIIREQGVLPATIAVIDGKLKAGLTDLEITELAKKPMCGIDAGIIVLLKFIKEYIVICQNFVADELFLQCNIRTTNSYVSLVPALNFYRSLWARRHHDFICNELFYSKITS